MFGAVAPSTTSWCPPPLRAEEFAARCPRLMVPKRQAPRLAAGRSLPANRGGRRAPDDRKLPLVQVGPAALLDCLRLRQKDLVDDVDDAVRLVDVCDGHLGGTAHAVPNPERAVLHREGEIGTLD